MVMVVWASDHAGCPFEAAILVNPCEGGGGENHRRNGQYSPLLSNLSVWSLHVLHVTAGVSSGCSDFLPRPKDMWVYGLISVWGVDAKVGKQNLSHLINDSRVVSLL